jgi:hypothetical protein
MPNQSWKSKFDEPIPLPDGRKLRTLKEAVAWLAKEVPKSEHGLKSGPGGGVLHHRGCREQRADHAREDGCDEGDPPASCQKARYLAQVASLGKQKLMSWQAFCIAQLHH